MQAAQESQSWARYAPAHPAAPRFKVKAQNPIFEIQHYPIAIHQSPITIRKSALTRWAGEPTYSGKSQGNVAWHMTTPL